MKIPGIPKITPVAKERRLKGIPTPLKIEKLLIRDINVREKKTLFKPRHKTFFSPIIFKKRQKEKKDRANIKLVKKENIKLLKTQLPKELRYINVVYFSSF